MKSETKNIGGGKKPQRKTNQRESNNHDSIPDSCPEQMDVKRDVFSNWSFFRSQWENHKIVTELNKKENETTLLAAMDKGFKSIWICQQHTRMNHIES